MHSHIKRARSENGEKNSRYIVGYHHDSLNVDRLCHRRNNREIMENQVEETDEPEVVPEEAEEE